MTTTELTIRVLLLEDDPADAELIVHELRRAGLQVEWQRVETETAFVAALEPSLNVILADYSLPQFDGARALAILHATMLDIPFIIVSGAVGEDVVVEMMQRGASDYLLKDRMARLGPAVTYAVAQRRARRVQQEAEADQRINEALTYTLFNPVTSHFAVLDQQGVIVAVNDTWTEFARENDGAPSRTAAGEGADVAQAALTRIAAMLDGSVHEFSLGYPCDSPNLPRWFVLRVAPLRAAERLYGWTAHEVEGRSVVDVTPSKVSQADSRELMEQLRAARSWTGEVELRHRNGTTFPAEVTNAPVVDESGQLTGIIGDSTDISSRKRVEAELINRAFHDVLSGLPNRALVLDRLNQRLADSGRRKRTFAVLFLDLDDFKVVNDSLGHLVGDQVLVLMAQRLQRAVRPRDTVGRFGGDEFVLLIDEVDAPADALRCAERILACIRQPLTIDGRELVLTTSIGIALGAPASTVQRDNDLLRQSDIALYQAKAVGKGRAAHSTFTGGGRAESTLANKTVWRRGAITGPDADTVRCPICLAVYTRWGPPAPDPRAAAAEVRSALHSQCPRHPDQISL